ncbi:MAG: TonB-dependent receptor [Prevotellaceae bacterium]|jgi:TonB-linked SusC/RagA family outer membrane protein|nr:TonB-dependent receptor [Prevotellaceae bacterium]
MKITINKIIGTALAVLLSIGALWAQGQQVTGKVTSAEDGTPLVGAVVIVDGTTVSVITDADGNYTITLPEGSNSLVFSLLGFKRETVNVNQRSVVNIQLEVSAEILEDVIMVGYATTRKGAITGAVGTVTAKSLQDIPVANATQLLQGQAAGVSVIANSGRPGASSTIRIRGVGSINAGTAPLYIIDGISSTAGDFSTLNTNDIESLTILKDASATAIYGSRASNGVVLVTTKGAKGKEAKITFKASGGVSLLAPNRLNLMNTEEKLNYEIATGLLDMSKPADVEFYRKAIQNNSSIVDEMMRDGIMQSYDLEVQGGTEKQRVLASVSYYKEDGVVERSKYERYTARVNYSQTANDWLKFGLNASLGYQDNQSSVTGDEDSNYRNNVYNPIFASYLINPYERLKNDDGSFNTDFLRWGYGNPLKELSLNESGFNVLNLRGVAFLEIEFLKDLTLRSTLGINYNTEKDREYQSPYSAWGETAGGILQLGHYGVNIWTQTNVLTYAKQIADDHNLKVIGGSEIVGYHYTSETNNMKGVSHPALKVPDAFTGIYSGKGFGGRIEEFSILSFFGNLNYNYKERYFLDLTLRTDASSRFGQNRRWGTFWSTGVSWNIKNEAFLEYTDWLSLAKLRFSVGTQGNAGQQGTIGFGNYRSKGLYAFGTTYNGNAASYLNSPSNDNLTWERSLAYNAGIDVGFVEDRYKLTVDWYRRNIYDMLLEVPVTHTSGFADVYRNMGEMYNTGIEVSVSTELVKTADWTVSASANFSYNYNEITKLFDNLLEDEGLEDPGTGLKLQVGHPYGEFYDVRWAGVNPGNGDPLWYDKNGNLTTVFADENAVFLGYTYIPDYTAGLDMDVSWKGIALHASFIGMFGKYALNNNRYFFTINNGGFSNMGQSREAANFWKQPGDVTPLPRLGTGAQFDERLYEPQDFVRLKHITLSYTFDRNLLEKTKILKGLRIYAQGENLLTITEYRGFDPENPSNVDLGAYPMPRKVSLGIDITF